MASPTVCKGFNGPETYALREAHVEPHDAIYQINEIATLQLTIYQANLYAGRSYPVLYPNLYPWISCVLMIVNEKC